MTIKRSEYGKKLLIINRTCFQDNRLSLMARGLYASIVSLPTESKINPYEMQTPSADEQSSLPAAVEELLNFGYCNIVPKVNKKGMIQDCIFIITEP